MNYILLPVFNEEKRISEILSRLQRELVNYQHEFIVVDDASRDSTLRKLRSLKKKYKLQILVHKDNKGPGGAFQTGFNLISKCANDEDIVVTLESDGSGDLRLLTRMIDKAIDSRYDVVLAGCFAPGGITKHIPLYRRILSQTINIILKLAFPISGVYTYSGFYRSYSIKALRAVYKKYQGKVITDEGFFSVVELLIKLSTISGIKMAEVPMTLDWGPGKHKSGMKVGRTIRTYLKYILKYKFYGVS